MHQMKDWLGLHGLDVTLVQDVLAAFRAGALSSQPFPALVPPCETDPTVRLSARHECFEDIVVPALACGLDDDAKVMDALHSIEFAALPTDGPRIPHTIDPGRGGPPVVVMEWHGRVDDLACLAHECAHAPADPPLGPRHDAARRAGGPARSWASCFSSTMQGGTTPPCSGALLQTWTRGKREVPGHRP